MANISRWDPFAGLTSLHTQLDDIFNDMVGTGSMASMTAMPAMDVYSEDDKQLVAEVSAPGFTKDDIQVSVHEGVLEIKGEKRTKEEEKNTKRTYMMRESSASFYRRIALPKNADGNSIEAHFDDGLLKVVVPYKELPQPKRIEIGSGKKK